MNDRLSTGLKQMIYELKVNLQRFSFMISEAERETGLKLSKFILEDEGFRALAGCQISDLGIYARDAAEYKFYSYEEWLSWEKQCDLKVALDDFQRYHFRRQNFLEQFKKTWEQVGTGLHELVTVYYGLSVAKLIVPASLVAAYEVLIQSGGRCCTVRFNDQLSAFVFQFGWHDSGLVEFDNQLSYLRWSIEEAQRHFSKHREKVLNACRNIEAWEQCCSPSTNEAAL